MPALREVHAMSKLYPVMVFCGGLTHSHSETRTDHAVRVQNNKQQGLIHLRRRLIQLPPGTLPP